MTRLRPALTLATVLVALVLVMAYVAWQAQPPTYVQEGEPALTDSSGHVCHPFASPGC